MSSRRLPAWFVALALTLGTAAACATQPTRGPVQVAASPDQPAKPPAAAETPMPNKEGTLKFAVLGDFGTATRGQFEMAAEMVRVHKRFPYEFVVTVGDNIYGSERPQDFARKFEIPYKPLLDAGVKFYASLGNHDGREQAHYKLFNMEGKEYYSMKPSKQNVKFFALETTYLKPEQVQWLEKELAGSREDWKIPYFHHPPYSSGERHGSHGTIRETLEPLFLKYNVSVVFTGHDHFYERTKPQQGIVYFVVGAGGSLRSGNIDRNSPLTEKGNDTDYSFLIAEIDGDDMYFNAITRAGTVIDSGKITRRK
jgi:3',5'-cyclic AMP phosphodiesterase CpdA